MTDTRDASVDDERTDVHLSSWRGQKSWMKVASAHLRNATDLTQREYVEALTIYYANSQHGRSVFKKPDIERLRSLADSSDRLIRKLRAIDREPEGKRILRLMAGLMRHKPTEPEIQKLLSARKLRASDKSAWEPQGGCSGLEQSPSRTRPWSARLAQS